MYLVSLVSDAILFQWEKQKKRTNSVTLVRERTIPTELQQLVGVVHASFRDGGVSRGQRNWSPRPYSRISGPGPLLLLPSSSTNEAEWTPFQTHYF
jgi:hypothetical protein